MVVPMSMGLASSLSISSRGFWPPAVYVWIVLVHMGGLEIGWEILVTCIYLSFVAPDCACRRGAPVLLYVGSKE